MRIPGGRCGGLVYVRPMPTFRGRVKDKKIIEGLQASLLPEVASIKDFKLDFTIHAAIKQCCA